jgi:hypothetical protein
MEKQRGMAFGFWKTATVVKKTDRQADRSNKGTSFEENY